MENPLVAIVLVNYNGFEDTVECIKSIQSIKYDNYVIIVVDNASTASPADSQIKYICENSVYVQSRMNLGFSGGNNLGIKAAEQFNPQYYLLLNSDTVVTPDFLNILIETAEKNDNVGIVTGKINFFSEPTKIWFGGGKFDFKRGIGSHMRYNTTDYGSTGEVFDISFATGCLMLIPQKTIAECGMLEESFFLYAEDTEYSCRVLKGGKRILFCEDALIYHKVSSSTSKMSISSQYYVIRNNLYVAVQYGNNRFLAYCYSFIQSTKLVLKGRVKIKAIFQAYADFAKNIKGMYRHS